MRLGLFMMPLHPPGPPMHQYIDQDTRKSLLLEQLGYDELWIGEHFSATSEPYPSPLMFMANLISQTKNIKFATGVINLPNRHPAVVAGEIAQFDHLSRGRLIFGAGTGSLGSDYELFDVADAAPKCRSHSSSRIPKSACPQRAQIPQLYGLPDGAAGAL